MKSMPFIKALNLQGKGGNSKGWGGETAFIFLRHGSIGICVFSRGVIFFPLCVLVCIDFITVFPHTMRARQTACECIFMMISKLLTSF
jgi:hypothetical protein